jgi:hypothetical protein
MTRINVEELRPGLRRFSSENPARMGRLQRALEILDRDRPAGRPSRTAEEIAEIALLAAAQAHELRTESAMSIMNTAMGRVLDDVEATRRAGGGEALRAVALRESDLRAIARAAEDVRTFEEAVRGQVAAHDQGLAQVVAQALPGSGAAHEAVGALNKSIGRGSDLRNLSEKVLEAWRSGHTLPERGIAHVVPNQTEPGLTAAMRRLEDAIDTYRRNPGSDAASAAAAADALQREYAAANESLRRAASDFDALSTGDVVPGRPLPQGVTARTGPNAEVAARGDAVRANLAANPGLVQAPRPQLLQELHLSDLDVIAEGGLREPVGREGLERTLLTPDQIRTRRTVPRGLAARLASLVEGWQRAHLIGPGFGSELIEGIMLAPEGINQLVQNRGLEKILRDAHALGADVQVSARARGRRLVLPLANGATEIVDILDSVHYEIPRQGRPPVVFDITVNPDGSWSASHHGTLDGVWDPTVPLAGTR